MGTEADTEATKEKSQITITKQAEFAISTLLIEVVRDHCWIRKHKRIVAMKMGTARYLSII